MTRHEHRVSRVPILVLVVVLLVVAAAFGSAHRGTSTTDARARELQLAATSMPAPSSLSAAWYCAAGTVAAATAEDETIVVSDVGTAPVHAEVEVMSGGPGLAGTSAFDVQPGQERRVLVSSIAAVASPGVVVEVFGGDAAVEHIVVRGTYAAITPCARSASSTWYLPAGTTAGAQQWLSLFDPFGDDAIVDVTFLTDGGPQAPDPLQGLVVPRRSKLLVPVHDDVAKQNLVATIVHARTGRVVAEQSLLFDGSANRAGLTLALGAPAVATRWTFPEGTPAGARGSLVVANPGASGAHVRIAVDLDGQAKLSPETIMVGAQSVVSVDLLAHVPSGTGFSVRVQSDVPVSVGQLAFGAANSATTVTPSAVTADRWVFAVGRVNDGWADVLSVVNPSNRTLHVRVLAPGPGGVTSVTGDPVAVPAGARVTVNLGARGVALRAPLTVEGDVPFVAERVDAHAPALTASLGIPDLS